jgi:hypothetical protein
MQVYQLEGGDKLLLRVNRNTWSILNYPTERGHYRALTAAQQVNVFPAMYGTPNFNTVFTVPGHLGPSRVW